MNGAIGLRLPADALALRRGELRRGHLRCSLRGFAVDELPEIGLILLAGFGR